MSKINYFTEEGLQKLKKELEFLSTKGRTDIANQIAEARDKGDLSENAEYDAAKEAQGLHELKISKIQEALANARVLDNSGMDNSKVLILSTVEIKNLKVNRVLKYTLVTESEADLKAGKISIDSPIGKGLLGTVVGDIAKINTPAGEIEFEIISISR